MNTTTADRYVSRARFSASDRPVPPDLDLVGAVGRRRARRAARDTTVPWSARLALRVAPFVARLAGVRRSARLALALLLATGAGDRRDEAVEGRQS